MLDEQCGAIAVSFVNQRGIQAIKNKMVHCHVNVEYLDDDSFMPWKHSSYDSLTHLEKTEPFQGSQTFLDLIINYIERVLRTN